MRGRWGFSLIELSAVLLIAGIAAGAVALRLGGPLARANAEDAMGQIQQFDHLARAYARRHDQELVVVIQLDRGRLYKRGPDRKELGAALKMPRRIHLRQAWVGSGRAASGQVEIPISRLGLSPSYAMQVVTDKRSETWLLVAGLTGQMSQLDHEKDVEHAMAAIAAATRADAD